MKVERALVISLLVFCGAFFFPRFEETGSGTISIRGTAPYDRTWKTSFGVLPKEWGSVTLTDDYDGVHHHSKVSGNMQTSPNWIFATAGLLLGAGLIVIGTRRR